MRRWVAALALVIAPLPTPAASPAADARREAIQEAIRRIERESELYGGGDWNRWFAKLAPFRAALRKRVGEVTPYDPTAKGTIEARGALLEARGDPPLFETCPDMYLRHLYAPEDLNDYVQTRPALPAIKAVAAWLKSRSIDVIVVPVPKMTEVYADRVVAETPADGIVAPQNRKLLLALLEADIEVVDLLPLFLEARRSSPEPLYRPADPHWAQRAMGIAAVELGRRLKRYDFVRRAVAEPPGYTVKEWKEHQPGAGYPALNPEQKQRVEKALTSRRVYVADGSKRVFSDDAPVVFIGDSYNYGLMDLVAREINMPVRNVVGGGHTTTAIRDFVRDPTMLDNCRVVVWVNHFAAVAELKWDLPPLR
jgi:hypothetical protein